MIIEIYSAYTIMRELKRSAMLISKMTFYFLFFMWYKVDIDRHRHRQGRTFFILFLFTASSRDI